MDSNEANGPQPGPETSYEIDRRALRVREKEWHEALTDAANASHIEMDVEEFANDFAPVLAKLYRVLPLETTPAPVAVPRLGEKVEIRGSFTTEGEDPEYGPWVVATVGNCGEDFFCATTVDGAFLAKCFNDEGKTWRRIPAPAPSPTA